MGRWEDENWGDQLKITLYWDSIHVLNRKQRALFWADDKQRKWSL